MTDREQLLENALWTLLDLMRGGTVRTAAETPAEHMEAYRQGWLVLGPEARARIEAQLGWSDA